MLWERQIGYIGGIIAIIGFVYPFINTIFLVRIKHWYTKRSVARTNFQIESYISLLRKSYVARGDARSVNIALAYSISLLIKGWSITSVAQIPNLFALAFVINSNNLIKSNIADLTTTNGDKLWNFLTVWILIGVGFIMSSYGRTKIDKGIKIRDSISCRPKFLNNIEKQICELEKNKLVDVGLLEQVKKEIALSKNISTIDWLAKD